LAVTGLVILGVAVTWMIMYWTSNLGEVSLTPYIAMLVGGGSCLILVGFVLVYASFRDRGAPWLIGLSVIGVIMAGPALLGGTVGITAAQNKALPSTEVLAGFSELNPNVYNYDSVRTSTLDLTDLPGGENPTYTIDELFGTSDIYVREDQPFHVLVDSMAGQVEFMYPDQSEGVTPAGSGLITDAEYQSRNYVDGQSITIDVDSLLGKIIVHVLPSDDTNSQSAPDDNMQSQSGAQSSGLPAIEPEKPQSDTAPQSSATQ
ncbi:MAG: hypothetical protein CSA82_02165, partial [Actinobacteria bacterium]